MNSLFGNWQTTLVGFIAAVVNYFAQLGPNLPSNGKEWGVAIFSAILAALGIVAKDAQVGSKAP